MEPADVVRRPPFGDNPQVGERGATTHRRILEAALDTFGEHGFHDTHVELITETAGCSRPSFYQYFSSKDDVFWRLAGELAAAMEELAGGLGPVAPDTEGVAQLTTWFDELIDLYAAYAPVFVAFPTAMRDRRSVSARPLRAISDHVGDALLRRANGRRRNLRMDGLSAVTVTMLLRTIYYWRAGLGQVSRPRFAHGTAQTIHRLLYGRIDDVNAGPVTRAPAKRPPRFPDPPTSDRGRPLRPRGQRTRQALIDAASAVLLERGYHDTRVDDVVAAAGLARGSFYRHFDTKDHLFYALAEQAAARMIESLAAYPEDTGVHELRRWLEQWFDAYRANGGVISAWQEIDYRDPELAEYAIAVAATVFDRLTRIVSRRQFGDATVDAIALLSIIEGVPYSVLVRDALDERVAIDASAVVIRRGLLGAPA